MSLCQHYVVSADTEVSSGTPASALPDRRCPAGAEAFPGGQEDRCGHCWVRDGPAGGQAQGRGRAQDLTAWPNPRAHPQALQSGSAPVISQAQIQGAHSKG